MAQLKSVSSLSLRASLLLAIVFTTVNAKPAPIQDLINMLESSDLDLSDLGFLNPLAYMSPFDDLFADVNMLPFHRFLPDVLTDALDDFPFDVLHHRLRDVIHGRKLPLGKARETIIRESVLKGADGKPKFDVQLETHNFEDGKEPVVKKINATGAEAQKLLEEQLARSVEDSFESIIENTDDAIDNMLGDLDSELLPPAVAHASAIPIPLAKHVDAKPTTKVAAAIKAALPSKTPTATKAVPPSETPNAVGGSTPKVTVEVTAAPPPETPIEVKTASSTEIPKVIVPEKPSTKKD